MRVLLPIKPQFAYKLFDGSKGFEFRRSIFAREGVDTVVVYASAPVKRVIGEFSIERVLHLEVDALWEATKNKAGITEDYFRQYFTGKSHGYALQVHHPIRYPQPLTLFEATGLEGPPPQSFCYLP